MSFLLTNHDIYCRPFPHFDKPMVIGFIGFENLKYVQRIEEKNVRYDLNIGIDQAKRKPPDLDVKLTTLLKYLLEHERILNLPVHNDLENAIFFCYRGLMTCIACTPYEYKDHWKIAAILYKGNIYLCARYTEDELNNKIMMANSKFTSWGFKFEQYIQSDRPDTQPNPDVPVNETEEFSLVFKTNLERHRIVFTAEMDGIRCDKSHVTLPPSSKDTEGVLQYLSTKEFVELKTNRNIEYQRQENNFKKFKTIRWWCQSFLTGVETILCGCRDDDGIVQELKVYKVKDLPKLSQKCWNPDVCFNFLNDFLTFVKRSLATEIKRKHGSKGLNNLQSLPLISLLFERRSYGGVLISENYSHEDDPILHDWFLDKFGKTFGN